MYSWAYKKCIAQGKTMQEATKEATADAAEAKAGEQGSNVLPGNGQVVRIYGDHASILSIAQYQHWVMSDYTVQAVMADMTANPQKYVGKPPITASKFTIMRVRSVVDPSTIK